MAVFGITGTDRRVVPVPGYNNKYGVGSDGTVWSGGSQLVVVRGYVSLSGGGKVDRVKVAYLVARAFLPNPEMRPYVRHRNGDPADNRAENLEWSEEKEERRGRRAIPFSVTVWRKDDGSLVGSWGSVRDACRALGVSEEGARRVLRGQAHSVKGYMFKR